jgi:hypothetical protein
MVRWTEGQTEIRRLLRWAALAALAATAAGAHAAQVQEVRVGTHDKSTRLVVELDQATGYKLVAPQEGRPELVIQLNAASVERDVPSKSPVVRKVTVEPGANGSTVHVRLATANVDVKELLLANPPRLVFDLTAQGPLPKVADEAPVEEPAAAEPVAAAEPAKMEVPKAAAEPIQMAEPKRAEPKPVVVAAAEPAKSEPLAEPMHPLEAKPAMPPPPVQPAEAPAPAPEPVAQQPVLQPPPMPASPPPSAASEAHREALAAKAKTLPPMPTRSDDSWMSLATSPMGLGVIGAAVLLLGTVVVMRRRRALDDEDPLYTVMAAEDAGAPVDAEIADEPATVRAAPIWEPDAYEASEPTPKQGPHQLAFGARPTPEAASEPARDEIAPPDDSDSIFGGVTEPTIAIAPPAPAYAATAMPIAATGASMSEEETERRLAELERRIEQLAEARERLERQVAAQTEELRVQRAAIARTQRVVRSIAKTEDLATEPVPRAPSAS